jgi:hypothetical protein
MDWLARCFAEVKHRPKAPAEPKVSVRIMYIMVNEILARTGFRGFSSVPFDDCPASFSSAIAERPAVSQQFAKEIKGEIRVS